MSVFDTDTGVPSETFTKTNARPMSEWSKLRRENPREYYKPKTQERMMRDASVLGIDNFLDNETKEWYQNDYFFI